MLQIQAGLTGVFLVGTTVIVGLVVFILLYIIVYQQKVNRFTKTLQQKELDKQHEIFNALVSGEEKERKRLAEELHDGIGARLSGIKMNIEYFRAGSNEPGKGLLDKVLTGLNEVIDEMREVSHNLQPEVISVKGLKHAIGEYMESLGRSNKHRYALYWDADQLVFKNSRDELMVYRVVSELLYNAHKHAQASTISLQISYDAGILQVMIEDDGIGFNAGGKQIGIGLINIQNRVNHAGGSFSLDSTLSKGTTIIIELPVNRCA
ncbi:MAG: sensor histidine kinase [Bacteroidota bacterium]